MVTSDLICPSTTLDVVPGGLDLRGSVRVWDLKRREIVRTISIPNAGGTIDVKLIPGDEHERGYTAGMLDDHLYLLNTKSGNARAIYSSTQAVIGNLRSTSKTIVYRRAFQAKTSAMKQRTALHAMMKATRTFFVGFRNISLYGSRTDSGP
jgi:hypothetical protein